MIDRARIEQLTRLIDQAQHSLAWARAGEPFMELQDHIHQSILKFGDFTIVDTKDHPLRDEPSAPSTDTFRE